MTTGEVSAAFESLIKKVLDPDSLESWSEQKTADSLRILRNKVLDELDAQQNLINRLPKIPERGLISPKPGERWG